MTKEYKSGYFSALAPSAPIIHYVTEKNDILFPVDKTKRQDNPLIDRIAHEWSRFGYFLALAPSAPIIHYVTE